MTPSPITPTPPFTAIWKLTKEDVGWAPHSDWHLLYTNHGDRINILDSANPPQLWRVEGEREVEGECLDYRRPAYLVHIPTDPISADGYNSHEDSSNEPVASTGNEAQSFGVEAAADPISSIKPESEVKPCATQPQSSNMNPAPAQWDTAESTTEDAPTVASNAGERSNPTPPAEPYRGSRCPRCAWALYDGYMCQNKDCEFHGKDMAHIKIQLSNDEAIDFINTYTPPAETPAVEHAKVLRDALESLILEDEVLPPIDKPGSLPKAKAVLSAYDAANPK